MKRMRRLISLLLSSLFLVALLAGCNTDKTEDPGTGDDGTVKDTFVIGLDSDIVKLDPAFAYDFTTNPVVNQITQGLLTFDTNNQLQPLLAKSWEQVDQLTYVYQIRDDVTFSDGSQMTMDDVIYSMERHLDPNLQSFMRDMYNSVEKMEVTGDWELTVTLNSPDATWQYVPATTAAHVLKKEFVEAAGEDFGSGTGGIIGTGPYKFVSYQSGAEVVLEQNENYWGVDKGYFKNLVFKIITEDNTRVVALQNGDIDCIVPAPASQVNTLEADENVTLTSNSGFGVTFIAFNTQRAPFNNADVRRAIIMAIDMDAIYTNLITDKVGDAPTVLPSSSALFTLEPERWAEYLAAAPTYGFDAEAARTLLADAGYADGLEFTLICSEDTLRNSIALAIQSSLEEIGVTMKIEKVDGDRHTSYQFGEVLNPDDGLRDYDAIMAGWEADYPDPSGNMTPLYAGGQGSNSAAYNSEEVNALIAKQMAESDPTLRNDLMFQAFDIIIEDAPYFFAFYPIKSIAINKAYTGMEMNASWIWNIHFQDVHPVAE